MVCVLLAPPRFCFIFAACRDNVDLFQPSGRSSYDEVIVFRNYHMTGLLNKKWPVLFFVDKVQAFN